MNKAIHAWRLTLAATLVMIAAIAVTAVYNPHLVDQLLDLEDPPHLPDEELIANFYRYRSEFERLRGMMMEDVALVRVTQDQIDPENLQASLGDSRVAEYRVLLRKVGLQGGISASSDRKILEFLSTRRGFVTHNSQKGYLYIHGPVDEREITASLDSFSDGGTGSGLRHIEANWYLYFEGY